MDTLKSMFPDLDVSTLQATLDAHDGSVERSVDYLLSSHSPNDQRASQEQRDAELARQLQEEDAALFDQQQHQEHHQHRQRHAMSNNSNANTSGDANSFGLPSLADVQSAVQPLVNGVAYAGRVAANSVSGLYRELVGEDGVGSASSTRPPPAHDDSVVVRNEGTSPAATRGNTRQRRPDTSAIGRSFGDKKDD